MRAHPGWPVTMFQICQLFGKAYGHEQAVTASWKCSKWVPQNWTFSSKSFGF